MVSARPKLLVLAPQPGGLGGLEKVTRALLRALTETLGTDEVAVAALVKGEEFPVPGLILDPGTARVGGGSVSLLRKLRFAVGVLRSARRWRGVPIFCCTVSIAPAALIASLIGGSPFGVWFHGYEGWARGGILSRLAIRRAHLLLAGSDFTARAVERANDLQMGRVRTLYYSLQEQEGSLSEAQVSRSGTEVLTVSRLAASDSYKGVDALICAWPQVLFSEPDARLTVIGDGSDRARLELMARTLGVDHAIDFRGRVSDEELADAYRRARLFALPGRQSFDPPLGEGFGLVFLEAAEAGLPVIAGRSGGSVEAVIDGETGLIVDGAKFEEIARAVVRLLRDPELCERIATAAQRRAHADFTFPRFRSGAEDIFKDQLLEAG